MEEGKEKGRREGGRMREKGQLHAQVSTSGIPHVFVQRSLLSCLQVCSLTVNEGCFAKTLLVRLTEQPSGSCYQRTEIRAVQWYEVSGSQVCDQMSLVGGSSGQL